MKIFQGFLGISAILLCCSLSAAQETFFKGRDFNFASRIRQSISSAAHLVRSPQNLTFPSVNSYIFPKGENACQIRLDFIQVELTEPNNMTNECSEDALYLSGASNTRFVGPLCGNLTGQHLYLEFGPSTEMALNIYAQSNTSKATWDIQVAFLNCDSPDLAPSGCLQYYSDQAGTVKSFNYNSLRQLSNQDYSVCIKSLNGMNKITWKTCGGAKDFFLTGSLPVSIGSLQTNVQPTTGSECTKDYIQVFGADKYCGNTLASSVSSITRPFALQVHFDADEPRADDQNSGFCLVYVQSPN